MYGPVQGTSVGHGLLGLPLSVSLYHDLSFVVASPTPGQS